MTLRGAKPLDPAYEVRAAREDEVEDLLPLLRGYCDFYESEPTDDGLRAFAREVIGDPRVGGLFIARSLVDGAAVGFAAMAWKWSSLRGAKVGYLDDLFVDPSARGTGVAEALIEAVVELARSGEGAAVVWLTAQDNHRAQAVYDRIGGESGPFLEYELEI